MLQFEISRTDPTRTEEDVNHLFAFCNMDAVRIERHADQDSNGPYVRFVAHVVRCRSAALLRDYIDETGPVEITFAGVSWLVK